jgi:hypothetical protein
MPDQPVEQQQQQQEQHETPSQGQRRRRRLLSREAQQEEQQGQQRQGTEVEQVAVSQQQQQQEQEQEQPEGQDSTGGTHPTDGHKHQQQQQQHQEIQQALLLLQQQQQQLQQWEDWKGHFSEMDSQGSVLDECCSDLEELVAREAYVQAAEIKAEITQLVMDDAVTVLLQQMQRALQSEDYAAVAQLRSEGWAWLEGWWASEGGQLLRVAPE